MDCLKDKHESIKNKILNNAQYNDNVNKISNIFSLLGEPNRMKILLALMEGELCVYHLCEITGCKQSATSQHLRKLKDNGIVKCRKDANQILYSISDEHITSIINTALLHKDCLV